MSVSRTLVTAACCLLAACEARGSGGNPVGPSAPQWRQLPTGLETRLVEGTALHPGWPALTWVVRADPSRNHVRVVSSPPPGLRASEAAARGLAAAVNANFFDAAGKPLGWLVEDGRQLNRPERHGWGVLEVASDGATRISAASAAGTRPGPLPVQAVQAGPRLVIDSRANPRLKAQVARRSFVGIDDHGRIVLGSTGPAPVDARSLAEFLAASESEGGLGLQSALNLDGGASSQLWVDGAAPGGADLDLPGLVKVPVLLGLEAAGPIDVRSGR